ncbi:MAG: hypothetical protein LH610_12330 [Sphingomonas bacterium]|nr:hypothetical protein [Sphingomonas bacterium]
MTFAGFFGFIAMLLATGEAQKPSEPPPAPPVRMMTIERQMILRVPVRPYPRMTLRWEEEKGPKCLPVGAIAGAMLSGPDSIDIVLRNRQRLRAKLDNDCEGLDFYGGLYLQTEDGQLCAKRDVIRTRVGGTCPIEKFRLLVPRIER